MILEAKHFLDGFDLWTYFGIFIERGSYDELLKIPKRKATIEHNFLDEHGIDKDLSRSYYEAREFNLKCAIIASDETDFWDKYQRFLTILAKPGTLRLTVTDLGRDFYVYYDDCTNYDKLTRISTAPGKIAAKFTLKVIEKEPGFNSIQTFIIDEENRFLIT
jgi:hypothetical protein